jgi:hypothetical protein
MSHICISRYKASGSKAPGDLLTKGGVFTSNPVPLLSHLNVGSANIFCTPWGGNKQESKNSHSELLLENDLNLKPAPSCHGAQEEGGDWPSSCRLGYQACPSQGCRCWRVWSFPSLLSSRPQNPRPNQDSQKMQRSASVRKPNQPRKQIMEIRRRMMYVALERLSGAMLTMVAGFLGLTRTVLWRKELDRPY